MSTAKEEPKSVEERLAEANPDDPRFQTKTPQELSEEKDPNNATFYPNAPQWQGAPQDVDPDAEDEGETEPAPEDPQDAPA